MNPLNGILGGGGGGGVAGGLGGNLGATDNAILRADGTGGATAQGSLVTIADDSLITIDTPYGAGVSLLANSGSLQIYAEGSESTGANINAAAFLPYGSYVYVGGTDIIVGAASGFYFWDGNQIGSTKDAGFVRSGTNAVRLSNAGSGVGKFLSGVLVEANTAGSGAPNVLTATESGTVLTNEGATAENYHTLPTAVAGYKFTFIVQDTDGIRVTAAAGDTLRVAGGVSGAAGFVRCATAGAILEVVAINATEWIAVTQTAVWTVDI